MCKALAYETGHTSLAFPGCKKVEEDIEKVEKELKDVVKRLETTEDLDEKVYLRKKEEQLRT